MIKKQGPGHGECEVEDPGDACDETHGCEEEKLRLETQGSNTLLAGGFVLLTHVTMIQWKALGGVHLRSIGNQYKDSIPLI